MTKLEKKRDLLTEEYDYSHLSETTSFKDGFDASTAEWKRIVEPLVEALKFYNNPKELIKDCPGFCPEFSDIAKEALEKYYEEIN